MLFGKEMLTEKGNLKELVVTEVKEQALAKIDLPLISNPNGGHSMQIGSKEDGTPIYLTVSLVVGEADPFKKRVAKARAKAKQEPIAFDLFGNEDAE